MGVETGPDIGGKASLVDDKPCCEPKQARAWGPLLAGLGSHCVKPGARTRPPKLRRHFHVDRTPCWAGTRSLHAHGVEQRPKLRPQQIGQPVGENRQGTLHFSRDPRPRCRSPVACVVPSFDGPRPGPHAVASLAGSSSPRPDRHPRRRLHFHVRRDPQSFNSNKRPHQCLQPTKHSHSDTAEGSPCGVPTGREGVHLSHSALQQAHRGGRGHERHDADRRSCRGSA